MRISDWSSDVCSSDLEGQHCMAKTPHLDTIRLERAKLESRLAAIIEREKEAEAVQRDAGRSALLAALDRVAIGPMERRDARSIAAAIGTHGSAQVAQARADPAKDSPTASRSRRCTSRARRAGYEERP